MKSIQVRSAIAALLLIVSAGAVQAQSPFGVDVRAGVAVPTGDIDELKTGFGFGASLNYKVMPHVALYAGWDWNQFRTDTDPELDIEDTGYTAGAIFEHPITPALNVWLLGGALYKHIEQDADGEAEEVTTDHGFGFEVGGGISLPIGERLSLKPGARYRSFGPDYGEGIEGVDITYFAFDLTVGFRF